MGLQTGTKGYWDYKMVIEKIWTIGWEYRRRKLKNGTREDWDYRMGLENTGTREYWDYRLGI